MKLGGEPQLQVRILSPTRTYYDSTALSVSAKNKVGPFDILAGHANFFSLLTKGDVSVNSGSRILTFPVTQGIMKVTRNTVTLFVDLEPTHVVAEQQSPVAH